MMDSFYWRPIVLLALIALYACDGEPQSSAAEVPRVKVFMTGEQTAGQLRRLSGKLVSEDTSRLSFSVAGTVEAVLVVQGQTVQAGEVLARLDPKPKTIAVDQARARLTVARANLIEAEQTYTRTAELFERQFASRADFEAAEATYTAARGNLEAAESDLEQSERDLARTELIAPFAGSIAERSVNPYQDVASGEEAFVLQSEQALKVEVLVPETLIRFVDYGQRVQVTLPSLQDEKLRGRVSEIGSRASSGNAFPVSIQLTGTGPDLRAGMTAAVTFNFDSYTEGQPVFLIPLSALALDYGVVQAAQRSEEAPTVPVFIVGDDNRIQVREVMIGGLRGDMLEVFRGLEAGDRVVSAGVSFLREGMEVELWTQDKGLARG